MREHNYRIISRSLRKLLTKSKLPRFVSHWTMLVKIKKLSLLSSSSFLKNKLDWAISEALAEPSGSYIAQITEDDVFGWFTNCGLFIWKTL